METHEHSGSKVCLCDIILSPSGFNQHHPPLLMTPDRLMTDKECVCVSVCVCVCMCMCVFGRGPQKARNQTALKLALHNYILTRA